MEKPTVAHIISHTHWDREWFLNSPFTNEWLVDFFDSLFAMLEKEAEYRFILDGQTLMVEDYLDELEKQGGEKQQSLEKLASYIKEGRLFVGPYYLQPDWQLVSGESLVRNLLIGREIARRLGGCMSCGWLLDNFGQISQAVQIHKGFGLKGVFLWRGVDMDPEEVKLEFLWKSPDGSSSVAVYLLDSYRNAMRLADYPEILAWRIRGEVDRLKPFATSSNILLMNGYDQETSPDDILPHLKSTQITGLALRQSTPKEFIEAIEKENPSLTEIEGYLYSGRFISVFPGVLSSRMYLKIMNDRCQRSIEQYAEPVASLCWALGAEYDNVQMTDLWKLLLKNHPHDSICGVGIDDVHTDMERRFDKITQQTGEIIQNGLTQLASLIDTSSFGENGDAYLVFNPTFKERKAIVTVESKTDPCTVVDSSGAVLEVQRGAGDALHIRLRKVPAFGYQTVNLIPGEKQSRPPSAKESVSDSVRVDETRNLVENRFVRVSVNGNGSLDLYDKISKAAYKGLAVFEDGSDAGDTYNYSPALDDSLLLSSFHKVKVDFLEKGPLKCTIRIKIDFILPEALSEDRKKRSNRKRVLPVVSLLTLEADSPFIKFKTLIKNTVKDHRLRVLFPTALDTGKSYAGTQFDVVEHEIHPAPFDDSQIPTKLKRVLIGAREPEPITTFPQRSFVDISDGKRGVAVVNRGLSEYEVLEQGSTIALTLYRSVGWLARGDLLTRVGDAGPQICTSEAQCLREMQFDYALYFHQGDWLQGGVHRQAEQFNSECIPVRIGRHPGVLPDSYGFLSLRSTDDVLKITALKVSEDGEGLILRCYNPSNGAVEGTLSCAFGIKAAHYTDLEETEKEEIRSRQPGKVLFKVKAKEIATLKLLLRRKLLINEEIAPDQHVRFQPEGVPEKEDFSSYASMNVICMEDIEKEVRREAEIEKKLQSLTGRSQTLEKELEASRSRNNKSLDAELHRVRAEIATQERTLLEARLSLVLSKKKYNELNPENRIPPFEEEELRSICRGIGNQLNKARIKKRTYDYLVDYLAK